MITRDGLLEKRASLTAQYEQSLANANAASGGLQIIDELLGELDEESDIIDSELEETE